jgi:hypothetical protein
VADRVEVCNTDVNAYTINAISPTAQGPIMAITIMQSAVNADIPELSRNVDNLARGLRNWNIAYLICLAVAVLVTFSTLVFSVLIVWWNLKLYSAQSELTKAKDSDVEGKLEEQQRLTEEQRQRAAEAETKLEEVRKKQAWRVLDIEKFKSALKDKPSCQVEILCQPRDDEAYSVGFQIELGLLRSGWPQAIAVSIPDDMGRDAPADWPLDAQTRASISVLMGAMPPTMRAGGWGAIDSSTRPESGIFVASNHPLKPPRPVDLNTPYGALINALTEAGMKPGIGVTSELPDNKLRIIVGPKP